MAALAGVQSYRMAAWERSMPASCSPACTSTWLVCRRPLVHNRYVRCIQYISAQQQAILHLLLCVFRNCLPNDVTQLCRLLRRARPGLQCWATIPVPDRTPVVPDLGWPVDFAQHYVKASVTAEPSSRPHAGYAEACHMSPVVSISVSSEQAAEGSTRLSCFARVLC